MGKFSFFVGDSVFFSIPFFGFSLRIFSFAVVFSQLLCPFFSSFFQNVLLLKPGYIPQFGFLIFLVVRKSHWNVDYKREKKENIKKRNGVGDEWTKKKHQQRQQQNGPLNPNIDSPRTKQYINIFASIVAPFDWMWHKALSFWIQIPSSTFSG